MDGCPSNAGYATARPRGMVSLVWILALGQVLFLCLGCRDGSSSLWVRLGIQQPERGPEPRGKLTVRLLPRQRPTRGVAVYLDLEGPEVQRVRALAMAPAWTRTNGVESVRHLVVRDERGLVDVDRRDKSGRIVFERPLQGRRLKVSYLAECSYRPNALDLRVSEDTVTGVGYTFLALPQLDRVLEVELAWDLRAVRARDTATSIGVGRQVQAVAKPVDLAHSIYLAGPLTVLDSDSGERLVAMGEPSFDLGQAFRFCSSALSASRQVFGQTECAPYTFVFVAQRGLGSRHLGTALYRSFSVWFDRHREFDARLRILVAHELVHQWLGGVLRVARADGSEADWFAEGFAVHYARSLLLRKGLISLDDYQEDLLRDWMAQRREFEARARRGPKARHLRRAAKPPQHHPSPGYHRGALYAARLEAQLRERGSSLDALIGLLLERVGPDGDALPESAWRRTVVEAIGPEAGWEFDQLVVLAAAPIELPADALGSR